jgi:hypothetical protein
MPEATDEAASARHAFATALANELDLDLTDEAMAGIDRILAALWLLGFKIVSHDAKRNPRRG